MQDAQSLRLKVEARVSEIEREKWRMDEILKAIELVERVAEEFAAEGQTTSSDEDTDDLDPTVSAENSSEASDDEDVEETDDDHASPMRALQGGMLMSMSSDSDL